MSYYLRGSINDSFYMVGLDKDNSSYIFGYNLAINNTYTFGFYLNENFTAGQSQITPAKMTYKDSLLKVRGFNIIENSEGGFTASTDTTQKLTFNPIHENVNGLYAGVYYHVKGNNVISFPIIGKDIMNNEINKVRLVPVKYYRTNNLTVTDTFADELNWIKNPSTFPYKGFTTKDEAKTGNFYTYCTKKCEKDCVGNCKPETPSPPKSTSFSYLFLIPFFLILLAIIFFMFRGEDYLVLED